MAPRKETTPARVPQFRNEQEAAEFWDTHSPLDYPEHFQEVDVRFSRPLLKRGLTVKLNDDTVNRLGELARAQGIGPTTLVRMWILEHLRQAPGQ